MRVFWGTVLLGVQHYRGSRRITIGEAKGTDVFISSEGLPVEIVSCGGTGTYPLSAFPADGEVFTP